MDNIIGGFFVLIFLALWLAALAFWIISIIEVVKIPDDQYKVAGTEKIVWILIVILLGVIGALVWRFVKRNDVLAAEGQIPTAYSQPAAGPPPAASVGPAAGWYPDPQGAAGQRYWDGSRWTEDRR